MRKKNYPVYSFSFHFETWILIPTAFYQSKKKKKKLYLCKRERKNPTKCHELMNRFMRACGFIWIEYIKYENKKYLQLVCFKLKKNSLFPIIIILITQNSSHYYFKYILFFINITVCISTTPYRAACKLIIATQRNAIH